MTFPISVDEDERKMVEDARRVEWDGHRRGRRRE